MATLVIGRSFNDGIAPYSGAESLAPGEMEVIDVTVAGGTPNLEISFGFIKANLQAIAFYADRDMAIYTNDDSAGTPQETLHLKAGIPYLWSVGQSYIGSSNANPFAGDVTVIYVTLAAGADSVLHIRSASDPTP